MNILPSRLRTVSTLLQENVILAGWQFQHVAGKNFRSILYHRMANSRASFLDLSGPGVLFGQERHHYQMGRL